MSATQYQVCVTCGRWTFNSATASCESARCTSLFRADTGAPRVAFQPEVGRPRRETIVARAVRSFGTNLSAAVARANGWRERAIDTVQGRLEGALWGGDRDRAHRLVLQLGGLIVAVGLPLVLAEWPGVFSTAGELTLFAVVALALAIFALTRSERTMKAGSILAGASIPALLLGLIAAPEAFALVVTVAGTTLLAGLASLGLVLAAVLGSATTLLVVVPALVYVAYASRIGISFLAESLTLGSRLSLLAPLAGLVAVTRARQVWDGIFFTCPSRRCAYRGLPAYVCPSCGEAARGLWPSLYGVLEHECASCGAPMPTLDRLGRDRLERRCGGCDMPLAGRHAGRARERLVAIAGATGSGKTNYLLMAVAEAVGGAPGIRAEIDDEAQADDFCREWRNLAVGVPAPKTSEVASAFLLYATVGRERCQLYLYDAPGEEFASIGAMAAHQYFPLLEGIVLLVDPLSFPTVREREGDARASPPLSEVVTSTLVAASAGKPPGRDGKVPLRVAVVVSKADLASVRERLGDIWEAMPSSETCRAAIAAWGGEPALRAIEHRFHEVAYFACSPLGRPAETNSRQPFAGRGVLEPLLWVLGAEKAR